jgi:Flp pilus assembly secretin CpaC
MSAHPVGAVARLVFATIIVTLTTSGAKAIDAKPSDLISVVVDQATIVKLPDRIATLVVGNPLIADVSLQPGGTMIVTGKSYGATNVMAIDRSGAVLVNRLVEVGGSTDKLVTVFRGLSRETYSCNPTCERRITLGDGPEYFKNTLDQSGAISAAAAGPAPAEK